MAGLLFFLTLVTLVVLLITTLISAIKRKPVKRKVLSMILIIGVYGLAWLCFFGAPNWSPCHWVPTFVLTIGAQR